jgi:hypothetical protein
VPFVHDFVAVAQNHNYKPAVIGGDKASGKPTAFIGLWVLTVRFLPEGYDFLYVISPDFHRLKLASPILFNTSLAALAA